MQTGNLESIARRSGVSYNDPAGNILKQAVMPRVLFIDFYESTKQTTAYNIMTWCIRN